MYSQLIAQHYEYIPVWAFNLGAEFGKSREDVCKEWYNLNVKLPPDYSFNEKENS